MVNSVHTTARVSLIWVVTNTWDVMRSIMAGRNHYSDMGINHSGFFSSFCCCCSDSILCMLPLLDSYPSVPRPG